MSQQIERICPHCRASQALSATYCNICGTAIERYLPQPATAWLPARVKQQLAHPLVRTVATGALVMLAQVVVKVLQQSLADRASTALTRPRGAAPRATAGNQTRVKARRTFWQKTFRDGTIRSDETVTWERSEH